MVDLEQVECAIPERCAAEEGQCSLCCLPQGCMARVVRVGGPNRCRLMELGFTSGTQIEVTRKAAFGGPLEIRLRSYRLSLRRDEAEEIRVTPAQ